MAVFTYVTALPQFYVLVMSGCPKTHIAEKRQIPSRYQLFQPHSLREAASLLQDLLQDAGRETGDVSKDISHLLHSSLACGHLLQIALKSFTSV